jgi:hypothetical protein
MIARINGTAVASSPAWELPTERLMRLPVWHRDNVEFWLLVCVLISALYALIFDPLRDRLP